MVLTAIVLTFNEERHIARCLNSVRQVADHILVVDSYSTDRTREIASQFGAQVVANKFINHASQFNFGLDNVPDGTDWVFRVDADELISEELGREIKILITSESTVAGAFIPRRICFQGRMIRHGGVFPAFVMRLFRRGSGQCLERWMDEHIAVDGVTVKLRNELIDDSLFPLNWWIQKHNRYSSLEALEVLNRDYQFLAKRLFDPDRSNVPGINYFAKKAVYDRLPNGLRAFLYFAYRYIFRFGFLDGARGFAFHFLQGFWYRYLVDLKVAEVRRGLATGGRDVKAIVQDVLEIRLDR